MPYSYAVYTGNGATTQFTVPFPYIRKEHVVVSLDYVSAVFTWVNNTTVQVSPAPANAVRVEVRRVTPVNSPLVDFTDGSTLVAADLDINALQQTYINQEQDDQIQQGIYVDANGNLTAGNQVLKDLLDPVDPQDAATKNYVDTTTVASAGDTMTGNLAMGNNKVTGLGAPSAGGDAANKTYVDTNDALKVSKAGDTMTGALAMSGQKITGLGNPTNAQDAATKTWVETANTSPLVQFRSIFYGAFATDQATDPYGNAPTEGDLYFNTSLDQMRVYNGASWQEASADATIARFKFTAVGGETSLSGNDDNAQSLTYNVGLEMVYLNGALLTRGVDYVATTGSSITGLAALSAADLVEVVAFSQVNAIGSIPSANSTFLQSGTGAVQRTVDSKLKDVVSVKDFGAVGDGVADDTAAIQAAINAGLRRRVYFPGGIYKVSSPITVPNSRSLYGDGMGFGGTNRRTDLLYTGTSGPCIQFTGFYTEIRDMQIRFGGGSGDKASCSGLNYLDATRTFVENVTILSFGKGIVNSKSPTTFTHLHRNVYIKDCVTGVDLAYFNNAVFDACFIESNGTNVKLDVFTNAAFVNGCVLEIFGDGRLEETTSSKCFALSNGYGFTFRDSYCEIGTLASAGTQVQFLTAGGANGVKGLVVEGNYFNRSANNQLPMIEFLNDESSAVSIKHNYVLRGPSSGIDYLACGATGFEQTTFAFDINNNAVKVVPTAGADILEKPIEFTPTILEAGAAISGIGYLVQEATCLVHAGMVTVNVYIALNASGTGGAGALTIPIPVRAGSFSELGSNNEHLGLMTSTNLSLAFTNFMAIIESGASEIKIFRDFATSIKGNNLTNTSTLRLSINFPIERQKI